MSDIKRPALISFNAHKVDDKKCKESAKTIRISLTLPESNEDTCPEYNYKEELAAAKRKDKQKHIKPTTNGLDPFNEDDDDVRRIAQEMEAKYGVSGPKRKRKGRRDDYADIGMGYDESDSFIDNTDGYDEMIPQNVTTLLGGFYINCGALEFKTDDEVSSEVSSSSSSEDEDEDEINKNNRKKRVLDSSSESEGEKETEKEIDHLDKKPKIHTNGTDEELKLKKKLLTPEKIKQIKKKRTEEKKKNTIKELLAEKHDEDNNHHPLPIEKVIEPDIKDELRDSMKENKKPIPADNISDIIESVVKGVDEDLKKHNCVDVKNNCLDKITVIPSSDGENSKDGDDKKLEYEIVKLPENLPNDIVGIIEKIKEYANKSTEGKLKFLSGSVCDTLLRLERKCKCLGKQSRMKIYEHLAPFVKCRKETLIKRTKNLVLEDDQKKIKSLVNRLKDEIDKIMPSLLDNYEKESQKIMQKKFSKESLSNEENKQLRMPKRRFSWTEETKKLLKEIILLRKKCFLMEGKNKDNLEALICMYLKSDIQILWPDGWMSMTALQKVCNAVLPPDSKKSVNSSSQSSSTTSTIKTPATSSTQSIDTSHAKEIQKLTSNTNLSITPVINVSQKPVNTNVDSVMSRNVNTSDITINKIDNKDISTSKNSNKTLPDMIKTSNSLTITPTPTITMKSCSERMKRIDFIEPNKENNLVIVEDGHNKQHSENNNLHSVKDISRTKDSSHPSKLDVNNKSDSGHCQIIDLTDTLTTDLKKKSSHKHKSKPYEGEKGIRVKTDLMKPKQDKDEISAKVCENLSEIIQQSMPKVSSSSTSTIASHGKSNETNKQYSPYSTTPPLDFQKMKQSNEGDEIHKAMESLKALQRLSSPAKANESLTSSPVSVIAYNKSYSPKGVLQNAPPLPQTNSSVPLRSDYKADYGSGFQEVFQRQFLNDFTLMQNSVNHSAPTSSKSHYNSSEKFTHSSDSYLNEKYYANSNNNFSQQNSGKMKNLPPQQSGSYNILDDMLANFLTEYGYPKAGTGCMDLKLLYHNVWYFGGWLLTLLEYISAVLMYL